MRRGTSLSALTTLVVVALLAIPVPAFASGPNDGRIVFTSDRDVNDEIFIMSTNGSEQVNLTKHTADDRRPALSPDGSKVAFSSFRDGNWEIYVMNSDGSNTHRISAGEGRYSTPVWSPRGDYIAFTKQLGGRFLIGVMRPDGSGERVLTEGFHNEGPTWAPNGRVLMFFRESQGAEGGARIFSVDLTGYNERTIRTPSFASDPAWSPLLN